MNLLYRWHFYSGKHHLYTYNERQTDHQYIIHCHSTTISKTKRMEREKKNPQAKLGGKSEREQTNRMRLKRFISSIQMHIIWLRSKSYYNFHLSYIKGWCQEWIFHVNKICALGAVSFRRGKPAQQYLCSIFIHLFRSFDFI